ncbi:potassium voltage-gated channel unc-103-like [Plodia interpunctella]|uniref:potassium voltage-gated channel unc-103-like n=1 Tax=Plodia interpunctella TaxID=58824 RepID=UPI0023675CBF|nr:potassium voltage-gated channel unc-103-like [Plodia interpunctella]
MWANIGDWQSKIFASSNDPTTMKNQDKQPGSASSHRYFQGHPCQLPASKLSKYNFQCSNFRLKILDIITVDMDDVRARNLFRSYAGLSAERYQQYMYHPWSLHPYSKLRRWIEMVFLLIMLYSHTLLAVHFSEKNPVECEHHDSLMYFTDLVNIFNIVVNLFTGYIEGYTNQIAILGLPKIFLHYARTWMIFDLLSAISFIPSLFDTRDVTVVCPLVAMKIFRIPTMLVYLNNILTAYRFSFAAKTVSEVIMMVYLYLIWNMYVQFAVIYVSEGSYQPENPTNCSWIYKAQLWNETTSLRFLFAFDRAVSMFRKNHIESQQIHKPNECVEIFFVMSWFTTEILLIHCTLKYIMSMLGTEASKAKYFTMIKQVEMYMNQRKFPPRIKKKILKFYSLRFQSCFFEESRMLSCVSGQLRGDIIMHTGGELVREMEFLKQLPGSLHLQICMKLKLVIFIAGDIIFKINTIGDCLYFIHKGTVAIYSESGREVCHLEDGDFFGEIALVLKNRFRTASSVAVTNCELFRLDKEDFEGSVACYPTVYEYFKKLATTRYERTCVLDEHQKAELQIVSNSKVV